MKDCEHEVHTMRITYYHCPYTYPCGVSPCESGESCPGKVVETVELMLPLYPGIDTTVSGGMMKRA